jgi:hypothetical protein
MIADEAGVVERQATVEESWRWIPSLYTVAGFAILGAIFLVALAPKLDTDLWLHLYAGRYIVQHHAVPTADFMSFTFTGRPWTDHEWLSEILLYGLYRLAGLWGTIVGFAIIIWASYFLVYRQLRMRGTHVIPALFLLTLAFICASPTWAARPQMITLLFLALFSLVLYRFEQTRDQRLLVVFPLSMLLWGNLHGGWVLGLVLIAVTLIGQWLNNVTGHENAFTRRDLGALAVTLLVSTLATAVNPNGLREVLYPLVWVFPSDYTNSLTEWVSPDFHMLQMMFFEGLLLITVASVTLARLRPNWTHLLIILAFSYLALAESRNVAVWSVVVTPILGTYVQASGPRLRELFPGARYRRRPVSGRIGSLLNAVLLVLVVLAYLAEGTHYVNARALRLSERSTFPAASVEYLKSHRLPTRVFAAYAWGGYLLWKSNPPYRDFIDGRANTLFDSRILHDYYTVVNAAPGWNQVLDRYHVGTVLIYQGSPLITVLDREHAWHRRHVDPVAVVYSRSAG